MHPALVHTDHRPWPLPDRPWVGRQSWRDLLFAHYELPAAELRPLIPPGLTLQERDGRSWVGVVPFRMAGVMARGLPDLPWISAFPELNVRLYVERDGKPGVWFLSLDAANPLAVRAARRFFHLPYVDARMTVSGQEVIDYHSRRPRGPAARFAARYRPTSTVRRAAPGTLDHFLTERYCLYAQDRAGALYRAEVHHPPWPLQSAEADVDATDLLAVHGLRAPAWPPLLLFARRIDVVVWWPVKL